MLMKETKGWNGKRIVRNPGRKRALLKNPVPLKEVGREGEVSKYLLLPVRWLIISALAFISKRGQKEWWPTSTGTRTRRATYHHNSSSCYSSDSSLLSKLPKTLSFYPPKYLSTYCITQAIDFLLFYHRMMPPSLGPPKWKSRPRLNLSHKHIPGQPVPIITPPDQYFLYRVTVECYGFKKDGREFLFADFNESCEIWDNLESANASARQHALFGRFFNDFRPNVSEIQEGEQRTLENGRDEGYSETTANGETYMVTAINEDFSRNDSCCLTFTAWFSLTSRYVFFSLAGKV